MPSQKPNLTDRLVFRLTKEVADSWRQQASSAGVSLSDFIRATVDNKLKTGIAPPSKSRSRRSYKTADPDLVRHLAWIGNNINQIARWVNSNKSGIEAAELLVQLNAIEKAFSFLLPSKRSPQGVEDVN